MKKKDKSGMIEISTALACVVKGIDETFDNILGENEKYEGKLFKLALVASISNAMFNEEEKENK